MFKFIKNQYWQRNFPYKKDFAKLCIYYNTYYKITSKAVENEMFEFVENWNCKITNWWL